MAGKPVITRLLFCTQLVGCVSAPSTLSFLGPGDFIQPKPNKVSEEGINKLMPRLVQQFGIPQNYLSATRRGALVGPEAGPKKLACEEGVRSFVKESDQQNVMIALDFDARPCFDKLLEQSSESNRTELSRLMRVRTMRSRIYTKIHCDQINKEQLNGLTALTFLNQGQGAVCRTKDSATLLLNYTVDIAVKVRGQPVITQAKLLMEEAEQADHGCQILPGPEGELATHNCLVLMSLASLGQEPIIIKIKSARVSGDINEPYFNRGHYEISINDWQGRMSFHKDRRPRWRLSRGHEIAADQDEEGPSLGH